jgi:hypothetical protein
MAHKAYTFRYRVRNWRTYNQALIARGGISFWIDEAALAAWKHSSTNRRRGAPRIYSDTAIQCAFVVKSVYGLSLRAAQGFVSSVMRLCRFPTIAPFVGDKGHSKFPCLCHQEVGRVTLSLMQPGFGSTEQGSGTATSMEVADDGSGANFI